MRVPARVRNAAEERRAKFPRFYFIGDDDLLEILGQSQNADVIQSHLKKLFQGVSRVEFGPGPGGKGQAIVAMCSSAGERVVLQTPVPVTDDVTAWLAAFTVQMVQTLVTLTQAAYAARNEAWRTLLSRFPSQVLCLVEQIRFCENVESTLSTGVSYQRTALRGWRPSYMHRKLCARFALMYCCVCVVCPVFAGGVKALMTVREALTARMAEYSGTDLGGDALSSLKVKALVMDAVHHLDVLTQLQARETLDVSHWLWQKQLRMYMDKVRQHAHGLCLCASQHVSSTSCAPRGRTLWPTPCQFPPSGTASHRECCVYVSPRCVLCRVDALLRKWWMRRWSTRTSTRAMPRSWCTHHSRTSATWC